MVGTEEGGGVTLLELAVLGRVLEERRKDGEIG